MKKLTRKLFISVLVAVFAFVALGTSTYAWITINTTAEVSQFEVGVQAGEAGIELTDNLKDATNPDTSTWSTFLTLTGNALNATKEKLDDVTTADGLNFFNYEQEFNATENKYEMKAVATKEGFVEFTIWIRQTNSTNNVNIGINGAKVSFTPKNGTDGSFVYNGDEKTNLFATNALRMSIATAAYDSENKKTETIVAIYEQNNANGNTSGSSEEGFAHVYAASQGITLDYEAPSYETNLLQAGNNSANKFALTGNTPQELTVRLWIEGWDNECHSKILNQSFSVTLGFEIVE